MGRLEGKVAIVTGAGCIGPGWGNGRAVTARFIEEGASVLAVDRCPDALVETMALVAPNEDKILSHICDVTDADQMEGMIDACQSISAALIFWLTMLVDQPKVALLTSLLTHGRRK